MHKRRNPLNRGLDTMVLDSTLVMITALMINHLVIYKNNKLIGSIFIFIIGLGFLTVETGNLFGVIIALIGVGSAIYSLTNK